MKKEEYPGELEYLRARVRGLEKYIDYILHNKIKRDKDKEIEELRRKIL